jgi:hypothetical protein
MAHDIVFHDEFEDVLKMTDLILFHAMLLSSKINDFLIVSHKFIANTYIHMRLLPIKHLLNSYEPKDFSNAGNLPLIKMELF